MFDFLELPRRFPKGLLAHDEGMFKKVRFVLPVLMVF